MTKRSAGILLYRFDAEAGLQVLLVHPGGPFFLDKDLGYWSIPKGEYDDGEDPMAAAVREFQEETGGAVALAGLQPLGEIRQRGGKLVTAWCAEGDLDVEKLVSNTFQLEWPPRSGRYREIPEVDRGEWFGPDRARRKLNDRQAEFVDRLERLLAG